ncbi:MAG: TolC family protein [Pseudomonadota bacterium]|nr:TolC family protein [Pseudomonadota bacterium]
MFRKSLTSMAAGACMVLAPVAVAETEASMVADPVLIRWVNQVLLSNPEMQAAEAAIEVSSGRLRAADQPVFNPELEFDYERSEIDTTTGGIRQAIDWADKRGARTDVADFELEAANAGLRFTRQRVATGLLQALADWHTADQVVRVSEKRMTLMERFVRLAERRRKAGDLNQVELDLAYLAAAEAAFDQANAHEGLIGAQQAISVLAGADTSDWPPFTGNLPAVDPDRLDVDHQLNELPAMRLALTRVAAMRATVEVRVRDQRPDPSIGFRVGKEDSDTLTGVTLSVPLFVRNTFSAEVDAANAELIQVEREAANRRRQLRAELIAAAQAYRNARRAWETWSASGAPRLSTRAELLDRLWQAGELDTTDYLVQLKQTLDTEISAIEQRGRMWRAWATWLAASGRADQWLNLTGEKR